MKLIFFRKLIFGIIIGALSSLILMLISAAILSETDDPSKNITLFSRISLLTGAFICGKVASIGLEKKLFQGLLSGISFALLVLLPSLILSSLGFSSLIDMLLTLVLAFAGAMIGAKRSSAPSSSARRKNVIKRYAH